MSDESKTYTEAALRREAKTSAQLDLLELIDAARRLRDFEFPVRGSERGFHNPPLHPSPEGRMVWARFSRAVDKLVEHTFAPSDAPR